MVQDLLTQLRTQLRAGLTPALRAQIENAVQSRFDVRTCHTDWGLLCEEVGLLSLAFREFQLALRDNAQDSVASFRLAHHYRERGETERAADLLEALLMLQPACEDWLAAYIAVLNQEGAAPRARQALERALQAGLAPARATVLAGAIVAPEEELPSEQELTPEDTDLIRFQGLFAGREDVHARQWVRSGGEGGYSPVTEPLTPAVVRNHLLGTYTVGVYPIRLDGACTFFALDLDLDRAALEQARSQAARVRQLRDAMHAEGLRLLAVLRNLGLVPLFEDSGYKGRHFWVFLRQPEPAEVLHQLGRLLLAWQSPQLPAGLHLEFFPKQASVQGKGLGNLIKLPLGIHRRTGRRAHLLDERGRPLARPLAALRRVEKISRQKLHALVHRLKTHVPSGAIAVPAGSRGAPVDGNTSPAEPSGPPPPAPAPAWTEADFQTDPRLRHLLRCCPVLDELKQTVDEHRRLSHDEQLVLIHTLGHVEGGPQAVNYLLDKCVDIGPEKLLKGQLRGNPVSCPSIRKKIGHITRRVACNCSFECAPDRYPTPVLHLLTLTLQQRELPVAPAVTDLPLLAQRFGACELRRQEIEQEYQELRQALLGALRGLPDRSLVCPGGRYCLVEEGGEERLTWKPDSTTIPVATPAPATCDRIH